jgi:hypothetical protein
VWLKFFMSSARRVGERFVDTVIENSQIRLPGSLFHKVRTETAICNARTIPSMDMKNVGEWKDCWSSSRLVWSPRPISHNCPLPSPSTRILCRLSRAYGHAEIPPNLSTSFRTLQQTLHCMNIIHQGCLRVKVTFGITINAVNTSCHPFHVGRSVWPCGLAWPFLMILQCCVASEDRTPP